MDSSILRMIPSSKAVRRHASKDRPSELKRLALHAFLFTCLVPAESLRVFRHFSLPKRRIQSTGSSMLSLPSHTPKAGANECLHSL